MELNRFFVALCAIATLAVSCQKEVIKNTASEDQTVVPEGMKYVSFEVGTPTKISGNPVKWNSSSEDISVLALYNGESVNYKFTANPNEVASSETTTITGIVDIDAELLYVVYPYKADNSVDDKRKIHLPQLTSFGYSNPGASSNTYFACKINETDGTYSAASNLKPLFSFLNLKFPVRVKDVLPGYTNPSGTTAAQNSPLATTVKITGSGITGATVVDFSGKDPVTTLDDTTEEKTLKVTLKQHKQSGLPYAGEYLVQIVPGMVSGLKFKVEYEQEYTVKYAAYDAEYTLGAAGSEGFSFVRGTSYDIELSGPFVKSVSTVSATFQDNTLTMTGSADVYFGGKVTAENYEMKFLYSIKDADDWTPVTASYDDGAITATATLDPSKTYEVKAVAVAKNALSNGEGTADQTIEGNKVETKAYVPPIVITIDKFPTKQYDGTKDGGNWKYLGGDSKYVYPTSNGRGNCTDEYAYYTNPTDPEPLISGVIIESNSSSGITFKGKSITYYGSSIYFPGKTGYKVTKVLCNVSSSKNAGKTIEVQTTTGTNTTKSNTYTTNGVQEDLIVNWAGAANEGMRIHTGAVWNYFKLEVTYTPID